MGVETVAFIPMSQVNKTAEFMQSVKNSINAMVKESYERHDVGRLANTPIPFILNQAKVSSFDYDVIANREHFRGNFSIFVGTDEFNPANAHRDFTLPDDTQVYVENEARTLWIFPETSDHSDALDEPKMVIQLGCWGKSNEIIKRVMDDYGVDYYFTSNDCAYDFELVKAPEQSETA